MNETQAGDYGLFERDPILQFFSYEHLVPELQDVSRPFCVLAFSLVDKLPRNAERSVALRKLLESKDAAVRAFIANPARAHDHGQPL